MPPEQKPDGLGSLSDRDRLRPFVFLAEGDLERDVWDLRLEGLARPDRVGGADEQLGPFLEAQGKGGLKDRTVGEEGIIAGCGRAALDLGERGEELVGARQEALDAFALLGERAIRGFAFGRCCPQIDDNVGPGLALLAGDLFRILDADDPRAVVEV